MSAGSDAERMWRFVKVNVVGLLTVTSGAVALVLTLLDVLPTTAVPAVTLAIVCLLATSELVEKSRALSGLQARIESAVMRGAEVTELSLLDDAFHYVAKRFRATKRTIDHVAFAPPFRGWPERNEYEDARRELLARNKVRYRYIGGGPDAKGRLQHMLNVLEAPTVRQYRAAIYFGDKADPPGISFLIIDGEDECNQELIVYFPRDAAGEERVITVRNPTLIGHLAAHFLRLWNEATPVTKENGSELVKRFD